MVERCSGKKITQKAKKAEGKSSEIEERSIESELRADFASGPREIHDRRARGMFWGSSIRSS